jgi:hypothetical protein
MPGFDMPGFGEIEIFDITFPPVTLHPDCWPRQTHLRNTAGDQSSGAPSMGWCIYHNALDLGGFTHRRYVHQQDGGLYSGSRWENASQCAYISQFHHPAVYIAMICFSVLPS